MIGLAGRAILFSSGGGRLEGSGGEPSRVWGEGPPGIISAARFGEMKRRPKKAEAVVAIRQKAGAD